MRMLVHAGLIGVLLGAPLQAAPFQTYGSCGQSYASGYGATYTSGPIVYPAGYYPTTTSYSSYQPVDYTFYRPASDLVNARLAQEAADAAVGKFKAELAAQAKAAQDNQDRQQNAAFQQMVAQFIQAHSGAPAVDPQVAQMIQQLQAENAAMKEALQKIAATGKLPDAGPPPSPVPDAPPLPPVPAPPKVDAPKTPAPPYPDPSKIPPALLAAANKVFQTNCVRCHGTAVKKGGLDLTHPEALSYEDVVTAEHLMISNDKEDVMPKDKPPGSNSIQDVSAVHDLAKFLPHRNKK